MNVPASLRWKLMLVCMTVVFIPVYFLQRSALETFDSFTRRVWEQEMVHVAKLAGRICLELEGSDPAVLADILRRTEEDTEIRLRWIGTDGRVLADSRPQPVDETTPNRLPGAEVRSALAGTYAATWELTPDRRFMYYYAAQPLLVEGQVAGVMHASRHTGPIMRAIVRMLNHQRAATVLALALAAAASFVFAQTLTRRLRRLAGVARARANGEPAEAFHTGGHDEIADLSRAFDQLTDALARRNLYNRDFIATVLHELRNPLTGIRGAAELLQQGADAKPAAREKFLANIRHQADRLIRMVGELNELTRVDTGSDEEHPRVAGDVRQALTRILDRAETTFDTADKVRTVRDLGDLPILVRFNEERLEQVLLNLLDNAYRYTPPGGEVRVRLIPREGRAVLSVEDTGPGIAPDILPRIFERFYTTEPRDPRREHGSGIGLAIVHAIVAQHGGTVRAESEPGRGARFLVSLPMATG